MTAETDGERIVRLETQMAAMSLALADIKESQHRMGDDIKVLVAAFNMGRGRAAATAKYGGLILMAGGALAWLWDHLVGPLLARH